MNMPTSSIRDAEIDLIARGYAQRFWRRGIMGTRVFAKGNERVVIVRNMGRDRHPPDDVPATVENWFERLEAVLESLLKGAKMTDLVLFGDAAVQVPGRFLDWCKSRQIQVHIGRGTASTEDTDTEGE